MNSSQIKKKSIGILILFVFVIPIPENIIKAKISRKVFGSNGNTLSDQRGVEYVSYNEFPEEVVKQLIQLEDKRFFFHPGFDLFAIANSLKLNFEKNKIFRGASTITQQLARIALEKFFPENPYLRKFLEILIAIKIELNYTKSEILEFYLNQVPIRSNLVGLPSASQKYFQKSVKLLSKDESLALIILIREPDQKFETFQKRFQKNFREIYHTELEFPKSFEFIFKQQSGTQYLPNADFHFLDFLNITFPKQKGNIFTSIDSELNSTIKNILNNEFQFIQDSNANDAAVVVLKLDEKKQTLNLISLVGSRNYGESNSGQVNGANAIRDTGSTLKPFIYAIAIDKGYFQTNSVVMDQPISFRATKNGGIYFPRNHDLSYWGPMTISEALANSRNIPTLVVLEKIGVSSFYNFLKDSGFTHLQDPAEEYGLGLGLGTGGASLLQLTHAFSILANGGVQIPIHIGKNHDAKLEIGSSKTFFQKKTVQKIKYILKNKNLRRRAFGERNFLDFPFPVALKTGTSRDFRDSWIVGFSENGYIVGAWVGNFNGERTNRVSGGWGAGRIFHQIMRILNHGNVLRSKTPEAFKELRLCRKTGKISSNTCPSYFDLVSKKESIETCKHDHKNDEVVIDEEPLVLTPIENEIFLINPFIPENNQKIPIQISFHTKSDSNYEFQIDEKERVQLNQSISITLPLKEGKHILRIFKNKKDLSSTAFRVKKCKDGFVQSCN